MSTTTAKSKGLLLTRMPPKGQRDPIKITVPLIKRMRALKGVGLSAGAVAAVIELDYGNRPSESTVRKYTRGRGPQTNGNRNPPSQKGEKRGKR
jgi:hypothetical protein